MGHKGFWSPKKVPSAGGRETSHQADRTQGQRTVTVPQFKNSGVENTVLASVRVWLSWKLSLVTVVFCLFVF